MATITIPTARMSITALPFTIWQYANFAESWYRDAVIEAQGKDGEHSTRREFVFAASFLESLELSTECELSRETEQV